MQHTSWLNTLAGEEYGRLWAWGNKPDQRGDYIAASPCAMSDIPQTVLEPVVVEEAKRLGAEFLFYTEFIRFTETGDGVETVLRSRDDDREFLVRSKYLVGADGARSAVLGQLGIPIHGRQVNTAFNVHIRADLSKYLQHRPGSLNWVLNTQAPGWSAVGNFRMVKPWTEFVVSMHPATKDPSTFQPTAESLLDRLHEMIGDKDKKVCIEILSYFSWSINDQVAERWHQGRVLCIGDATHRHPPINGLGSNTCLSDAFNLAWKLAYVLKGYATPSLLETLTPERKPVGDAIVRRANEGMEAHRRLWAVLGLDSDSRLKATKLLKSTSDEGKSAREQLRDAIEATEDEVQALGIQMNQVYHATTAIIVEPGDVAPDFSTVNALRKVFISTFPGYHLPHVWLAADALSPRMSTLDLSGDGCFTLFTGIGGSRWMESARAITEVGGVKVKAYSIGFGCDYMDCYRDWAKISGVNEDGAVLVRPDHFIAWRCATLVDNTESKLRSVLNQILSR